MNELLNSWLGDNPQAVYNNWTTGFMGTPGMQDYFKNAYGGMYNRYLGGLAGQAMGGTMPTQSFQGFLGGFNPQREFNNLPNYLRGWNPSAFAPRSRWLMY